MNIIIVFLYLIHTFWVDGASDLERYCRIYNHPAICINNNIRSHVTEINYEYFDGELVHIECWPQADKLIFQRNDETIYETGLLPDAVSMLVKLTSMHDGAVFECWFGSHALTISLELGSAIVAEGMKVNDLVLRAPQSAYYLNNYEETIVLNFSYAVVIDLNTDSDIKHNALGTGAEITPGSFTQIHSYVIDFVVLTNEIHRAYHLDVIGGPLCFGPYFTGLNVSKVIAKYKASENLNIIKYELDFQDDIMYFGCDSTESDNYNLTVNGKISKTKKFKLFTKNSTTSYYKLITCTVSHVFGDSSTILNITRRRNMPLPTPRFIDEAHQRTVSVQTVAVDHIQTICNNTEDTNNETSLLAVDRAQEIIQCTNTEGQSIGVMLTSIFVTMILTIIFMTVLFKVYLRHNYKRTPGQASSLQTVEDDAAEAEDTLEAMESLYEPVGYSSRSGNNGEPIISITKRPQFPLPPEEREENKKYLHYDTPYEHRIFRFGIRPHTSAGVGRSRQSPHTSRKQ